MWSGELLVFILQDITMSRFFFHIFAANNLTDYKVKKDQTCKFPKFDSLSGLLMTFLTRTLWCFDIPVTWKVYFLLSLYSWMERKNSDVRGCLYHRLTVYPPTVHKIIKESVCVIYGSHHTRSFLCFYLNDLLNPTEMQITSCLKLTWMNNLNICTIALEWSRHQKTLAPLSLQAFSDIVLRCQDLQKEKPYPLWRNRLVISSSVSMVITSLPSELTDAYTLKNKSNFESNVYIIHFWANVRFYDINKIVVHKNLYQGANRRTDQRTRHVQEFHLYQRSVSVCANIGWWRDVV